MTRADFNALMAEVSDYFGDKTYAPKQLGVIWRIMEPLDTRQARQVIEAIVQKHHRPPMPAAFKAEAYQFLNTANQARRQEAVKATPACRICDGTGMMHAILKSNPAAEFFSFACPYCSAAEIRGLVRIPRWTEASEKDFVKVSLKVDSHRAASDLRNNACRKYHRKDSRREEMQRLPENTGSHAVLPSPETSGKLLEPVPGVQSSQEQDLLPGQPPADQSSAAGVSENLWS